jgi:hypothetical protein
MKKSQKKLEWATSSPEKAPQIRQLLKAKEAAQVLNVSENTTHQWIWQRRSPVVRLRLEDPKARIERHREEEVTF